MYTTETKGRLRQGSDYFHDLPSGALSTGGLPPWRLEDITASSCNILRKKDNVERSHYIYICVCVCVCVCVSHTFKGARCSSVVRAFAHGAMGRRIDPSWGEPIELFFVLACAPRLV